MRHRRRLDNLDAMIPSPAAPPPSFGERVVAILLHIHQRWAMSTTDAVKARKVKPGVREEFPSRGDLMTWDGVPRELWGGPPHLHVHLLDPLTYYSICTSGQLWLLEIVGEWLAEQGCASRGVVAGGSALAVKPAKLPAPSRRKKVLHAAGLHVREGLP